MSKRHADDFCDLTDKEWEDILPVLKDSIAKIDQAYHPLGYQISMPTGAKASQNEPPHFYMRVVPKYKKNWGTVSIPLSVKSDMEPAEFATRKKLIQGALQPNQDGVIAEKSKLVAKLLSDDKSILILVSQGENLPGAIIIATANGSIPKTIFLQHVPCDNGKDYFHLHCFDLETSPTVQVICNKY